MTWNLLHATWVMKDTGGIPAYGKQRSERDAGCRVDFENPEHRWENQSGGRFTECGRRQ